MIDFIKPHADSIQFDGLGSIIARQGSQGPRIMVDAHMDELGGMVRRITPKGLLTMQMLGGWLEQALVDQRWIIVGSKGPVRAVTGIRDVHVVPPEERTRVFPRDSLFLDVGAKDEAETLAMGVSPGDPVVPDAPFTVLNGSDNYLGKPGTTGSGAASWWRRCGAWRRCHIPTRFSGRLRRRKRSGCAALTRPSRSSSQKSG